jgi:hypothetical protein
VTEPVTLRQNVLVAINAADNAGRVGLHDKQPETVQLLAARAGAVRIAGRRHQIVQRFLAVLDPVGDQIDHLELAHVLELFEAGPDDRHVSLLPVVFGRRERLERVGAERVVTGIPATVRLRAVSSS